MEDTLAALWLATCILSGKYCTDLCHMYFMFKSAVNSRYSGHPWDYPKWLEYRGGCISGYLEIPAAIFETVSRASSPSCKVIVTG